MNSPRFLTMLNAVGCLVLGAWVVVQWLREREADLQADRLRAGLAEARALADAEATRRAALERDIAVLKDAVGSTQRSAEESARGLAERDGEVGALRAELDTARSRLAEWEDAVRARDRRIRELESQLAEARKRLVEAVERLKTR
ncbi:MAG: hypothetical protein FJ385_02155 [Verrucomicrobia bacterium]|nr:hypothetical protein [Verrucomicrobiota bacterium]